MAAKDDQGAEGCFRRALLLKPDFGEVLANLGLLRERVGAMEEAEACYRQAVTLCPESAQIYLNLGVFLVKRKRLAEAEIAYRQAFALAPENPAVWSNFGVLKACAKQEEEAEQCYRTALALDGTYAKARFNLSYLLLRQGHWEEGWACLEARDWYNALGLAFSCPRWRGESLFGKSILLGIEAGHGDMIQFCRYAAVLKTRGAVRVDVVCHPGLKALFNTLSGIDTVFSPEDEIPVSGWDFWSPPMSLPHYCQTRLENIPAVIPYLFADPLRVAKWQPLLPASDFRVGLVWKGNPRFENDEERSLPSPAVLAPLGELTGIGFVSLQKESEAEEEGENCLPASFFLRRLGAVIEDFADTAAIVSCLDLVITVDTAVAHLAGAMGKPCWVLLPDYMTDWRWLCERTDSPWYPKGMRLFRQPPGGGWRPVIEAVVGELRKVKLA